MSKSQVNNKKKLTGEEPATLNKKQKLNEDEGKKVALKKKNVQSESESEAELVAVPKGKQAQKVASKAADTKKKPQSDDSDESSLDEEFSNKKSNGTKAAQNKVQPKKAATKKDSDDESEDSAPPKKNAQKPAGKQVPKVTSEDEESEEEPPKTATKKTAQVAKGKAVTKKPKDDSDESEEEPPKPQKTSATSSKLPAKKTTQQDSDSDESEEEIKPKGKAASVAKPTQSKKKDIESEESDEEEKAPAQKFKQSAQQKKVIQNEDEEEEEEDMEEEDTKPRGGKSFNAPAADGGQKGVNEVFVGNLPFNATEGHITEFFSSCGKVVGVNLLKGYDGRSKGIAFVRFDTEKSTNKAVEQNGADYDGRALRVEKSTPKEARAPREGNYGGDKGSFGGNQPQNERDPNSTTVFVGNLSYGTTQESLRSLFETCGAVKDVRVAHDKEGNPRGFAHVEFVSTDSIDRAIAKAGQKLDGRPIRVDFSGAKKEGGDGARGGRGFGGGNNGFRGGRQQGGYDDGGARKGNIGTYSGNKVRL